MAHDSGLPITPRRAVELDRGVVRLNVVANIQLICCSNKQVGCTSRTLCPESRLVQGTCLGLYRGDPCMAQEIAGRLDLEAVDIPCGENRRTVKIMALDAVLINEHCSKVTSCHREKI